MLGNLSKILNATMGELAKSTGQVSPAISPLGEEMSTTLKSILTDIHPEMNQLIKDMGTYLERSGVKESGANMPEPALRNILNNPACPMERMRQVMQEATQMQNMINEALESQHRLTESVIQNIK